MYEKIVNEAKNMIEELVYLDCGDIFEKLSPHPQKTLKSLRNSSRKVCADSTKSRANYGTRFWKHSCQLFCVHK